MRISIDETDFDDAGCYRYRGEPFTGEMIEASRSGQVIELMTVRSGTMHGPQRAWYEDGTLKSEFEAVNGVPVGVSRQWHMGGQLAEERRFNEQGDMISIRRWAQDGAPVEPHPSTRPPE